jgi:hypothetical protein
MEGPGQRLARLNAIDAPYRLPATMDEMATQCTALAKH